MDKKKPIGGLVLIGIGLSLLALGFYILFIVIGHPLSEPGKFQHDPLLTILGLFFFICGLVSTISGGIILYISRK